MVFKDVTLNIPASAIIEDIQMLKEAKETGDTSLINTTIECLEGYFERCATIPDTKVTPSPTSVIAPSVKRGIIINDDGSDLKCAGGISVSKLNYETCDKACPHYDKCSADKLRFVLDGGYTYNENGNWYGDEELVSWLENRDKEKS